MDVEGVSVLRGRASLSAQILLVGVQEQLVGVLRVVCHAVVQIVICPWRNVCRSVRS